MPTPHRSSAAGSGLLDDTDHLVTGDELERSLEMPGVLLVVGPTEPTGLDSEESVLLADLGQRNLAPFQPTRLAQHGGRGVGGRHRVASDAARPPRNTPPDFVFTSRSGNRGRQPPSVDSTSSAPGAAMNGDPSTHSRTGTV